MVGTIHADGVLDADGFIRWYPVAWEEGRGSDEAVAAVVVVLAFGVALAVLSWSIGCVGSAVVAGVLMRDMRDDSVFSGRILPVGT